MEFLQRKDKDWPTSVRRNDDAMKYCSPVQNKIYSIQKPLKNEAKEKAPQNQERVLNVHRTCTILK